jgi:hypothetical protein
MQIVYRKLFEVEIRHDYFLLPGLPEKFATDFKLSKLFTIQPSSDTEKMMQDHKMLFRTTDSGFVVLIRCEYLTPSAVYASAIDLDDALNFSFYWTLNDPHALNYTNQRIIEQEKKIYFFSTRTGSVEGTVNFLNTAIPAFGSTYLGEPLYRLGDIIRESGATYELIEKESPVTNFPANAAKWQKINDAVVNYINPNDRIMLQGVRFVYERTNSNPGENITARLLDDNSQEILLGTIMGTGQSQGEYTAPLNGTDPVNFVLDFSHIKAGLYTLEIHEASGINQSSFYLMDPMIKDDLFAVSSFYVSGNALPFTFIREDPALKRWITDDPAKMFTLRFRNRLTRWKYLNQDDTIFDQPAVPRPLSKTYSGYTVPGPGGTTINMPDPTVDKIYPELEVTTNLIKNIYSNIILTK